MLFFLLLACPTDPIDHRDVTAFHAQAPDPAPLRRLTSTQYLNTIEDLFPRASLDLGVLSINTMDGYEVQAIVPFPAEQELLGFDNNAAVNSPTPVRIEVYQTLAQVVAEQVTEQSSVLKDCGEQERCRIEVLKEVANAAWRRPLTQADDAELTGLFQEAQDAFGPQVATEMVLQFVLQAPEFLYFIEAGMGPVDNAGGMALSSHEVATRLSYLLWNTMPDEDLRTLADQDGLATTAGVERETWRMMGDDRFDEGVAAFHNQWMGTSAIDAVEVDYQTFASQDYTTDDEHCATTFKAGHLRSCIKRYMETELELFVQHELKDSGTLRGLLTSNRTHIPLALGPLYGVEVSTDAIPSGTSATHEAKQVPHYPVDLPGDERAGFLTLLGSLHARTNAQFPSPVQRGVFIKERLLCQPISQPATDIPTIEEVAATEATTNRERYQAHAQEAACASCHRSIDGIGFTFENYGPLGVYQTTDGGETIDASGELVGTDVDGAVENALDLVARLSDSQDVHDCYVTQWVRYGFGREEAASDEDMRTYLNEAFWTSGGDIQDLIVRLSRTHTFRYIEARK